MGVLGGVGGVGIVVVGHAEGADAARLGDGEGGGA